MKHKLLPLNTATPNWVTFFVFSETELFLFEPRKPPTSLINYWLCLPKGILRIKFTMISMIINYTLRGAQKWRKPILGKVWDVTWKPSIDFYKFALFHDTLIIEVMIPCRDCWSFSCCHEKNKSVFSTVSYNKVHSLVCLFEHPLFHHYKMKELENVWMGFTGFSYQRFFNCLLIDTTTCPCPSHVWKKFLKDFGRDTTVEAEDVLNAGIALVSIITHPPMSNICGIEKSWSLVFKTQSLDPCVKKFWVTGSFALVLFNQFTCCW